MKITKSQLQKIIKESILEESMKEATNALLGRVRTVLTVLGAKEDSKNEELMATLTQAVHKIETDEDYKASLKTLSTAPSRSGKGRERRVNLSPDENPFYNPGK
jgi:hypothetical protein